MEAELTNIEDIVELPANSTESGRNDLFSTLPDDCIYSIFSFLDRVSFETMQCVSQKMQVIIHYIEERIRKKNVYEFILEQNVEGQTICVSSWDEQELSLAYTTSGNSQGVKTQFKCSYYDWKSKRLERGSSAPVNINILNELKIFSLKYVTNKMRIVNIQIDKSFIPNLIKAFRGKVPVELEFENVSIHEKVDLAKLIVSLDIRELTISSGGKSIHKIFDEEFVNKFSHGDCKKLRLDFKCWKTPRWTPSRDLLPVICQYDTLSIYTLVLTTNMLEELIMLCFDTIDCEHSKYWSVSLNWPLDQDNFRFINNEMFSIEKDCSEEPAALIIRKKNRKSRIEIVSYKTINGLYPILIVHSDSE